VSRTALMDTGPLLALLDRRDKDHPWTVDQMARLRRPLHTCEAVVANVPMSLADACLVRMSERVADGVVFTLDSDFRVYRRHGKQKIPLLIPGAR
jgi:predicted nucleic acid-binding protein